MLYYFSICNDNETKYYKYDYYNESQDWCIKKDNIPVCNRVKSRCILFEI